MWQRSTAAGVRGRSEGHRRRGGPRPSVETLEGRELLSVGGHHRLVHAQGHGHGHGHGGGPLPSAYMQTNLVSDGSIAATHTDAQLVNPWGLASGSTTPFWASDNGTGVATLYNGDGVKQALVVTIPGPGGGTSAPTGVIFNTSARPTDFQVGGTAARFLFATEDGTIAAWASGTMATTVVDRSGAGSIYKGLAAANTAAGSRLYATDFHNGKVDVWDGGFNPVTLGPGAFHDPRIPAGYAPFGIANVGGNIVVTYALQDANAKDDVPGQGRGFVDVFDPDGNLLGRVGVRGQLNAPWGIALAPLAGFGRFSGDLLVGNFGNGRINAFRSEGGRFRFDGQLMASRRAAVAIDGLWGLQFGSNVGRPNVLYFTAGPNDEQGGLFGTLAPA